MISKGNIDDCKRTRTYIYRDLRGARFYYFRMKLLSIKQEESAYVFFIDR